MAIADEDTAVDWPSGAVEIVIAVAEEDTTVDRPSGSLEIVARTGT